MANRDRKPLAGRRTPIVAVGAVIWSAKGEVLLVRRGSPPRQDEWSIPGGKIAWGETVEDAVAREVREETGLEIEILGLIDIVDSLIAGDKGRISHHHVLLDFTARAISGPLRAGGDARAARWVAAAALEDYPMWEETRRIIAASAGAIARSRKRGRPARRGRK